MLNIGDTVIFDLGEQKYEYVVRTSHLGMKNGSDNSIIFTALKLRRQDFADEHYGYGSTGGGWPSYKDHDMSAATRLVNALKIKCHEVRDGKISKFKEGQIVHIREDLKGYAHGGYESDWAGREVTINKISDYNNKHRCYNVIIDLHGYVMLESEFEEYSNSKRFDLKNFLVGVLPEQMTEYKYICDQNNIPFSPGWKGSHNTSSYAYGVKNNNPFIGDSYRNTLFVYPISFTEFKSHFSNKDIDPQHFCIRGITIGNNDDFNDLINTFCKKPEDNHANFAGGMAKYYGVRDGESDFGDVFWGHIFDSLKDAVNYFNKRLTNKKKKDEVQNFEEKISREHRGSAIRVSSRGQQVTVGRRHSGNEQVFESCRTVVTGSEVSGSAKHQRNLG